MNFAFDPGVHWGKISQKRDHGGTQKIRQASFVLIADVPCFDAKEVSAMGITGKFISLGSVRRSIGGDSSNGHTADSTSERVEYSR